MVKLLANTAYLLSDVAAEAAVVSGRGERCRGQLCSMIHPDNELI